jgi:hypothetical protein
MYTRYGYALYTDVHFIRMRLWPQAERKKKDADDEVVDAPKESEPANSN